MAAPSPHHPVLLPQVLECLAVKPGAFILDGTLGYGGHSEALLRQGVTLWGVDRDPQAIQASSARLLSVWESQRSLWPDQPAPRFFHAPFSEIPQLLSEQDPPSAPDGILLDLGVSSPQLDQGARGFSFRLDGPLDMRMDPTRGVPASQFLEEISEEDLVEILFTYGEERQARRIARAIRAALPLTKTSQLANLVADMLPAGKGIHPATRTFQAIRIAVNRELGELDDALATLPSLLAPEGRLSIISFHSLEDRRVKERFRELAGEGSPVDVFGHPLVKPLYDMPVRKPYKGEELDSHPRARSARLRVVRRLPGEQKT